MTLTPGQNYEVGIVVNNYNYARFLPAAIESALAQTYPRTTVIVVDDGSTDDSRTVLDAYADRISVVLKENGGQASALNAGMARCQADIVIFLDADDVLHPTAAANVVSAFAVNPALAKVQYRMEVIDRDGRPTGTQKPAPHLPLPAGDLRAAELAYPFDLVWMSTSANAFRADAVRRILPIPEREFRICADWYLVHLTTLIGEVLSLTSVEGGYRMHGTNHYEPQDAKLDLGHVRDTIRFAASTAPPLLALGTELGLPSPDRILSISDLGQRMVSLRLEPQLHPVADDSRRRLLRDAVGAAHRRDNVSMPMRAVFLAWFAAMVVAPRPLARHLARSFLFPDRRRPLNHILGRLQRRQAKSPPDRGR